MLCRVLSNRPIRILSLDPFTTMPRLLRLVMACAMIVIIPRDVPAQAETASLEAFMDSVMAIEIREYGVPGLVVTVVRDGRVVLAKGYGVADRRTRRPMSAEGTVMRVGSVSKPVTALAVLQLAEAGRIDLEAPVERYLPGVLRGRGAGRVRVRDLLTHTAGLDVRLIGTTTTDPARVLPLRRSIERGLPPVVHRPGETVRYSNQGYVLLGRLVEVASGEPFDAYVRRHVLAPLGMRSSGFRLEGELARRAATGYEGERRAVVLHPHMSPAAGLNTTAADMGRWMVALLDSGRIAGSADRLVSARTAALGLGRQFGMHPGMPGWTFGMFEVDRGGVRGVGHSGGIRGFMSGMYLWPEQRTGLFISDNGYDGDAVQAVFYAFADRYLARLRAEPPPPAPGAVARAARVAGTYRSAALAVRTLERAGSIRRGDLRVAAAPDGSITVFGLRFVEVEPGRYRQADGDETVAFLPGPPGEARWLLTGDPIGGNQAWGRLAWWQTAAFHQTLGILCLMSFGSLPWIRPRRPGGVLKHAPESPAAARARTHRRMVAAGYLAFFAALVLAFRGARATGLLTGVPLGMRIALGLGLGATVLAAALPVTGWRLRQADAPRAELALHAAVFLVALAFAWQMWTWNLLGFRFG
jgi:CubicO group peptidase (beta-lactamase class C family)